MQLHLGSRIREFRQRDGITQETLADALGVTSQAVSRWESAGSYPDMEIIPSIANYFGVSIDELFGYHNAREKRIDELAEEIHAMNAQNNGVNIHIDECIARARKAMLEFPDHPKIMLSLASVLYNAGYVRYGEHHLIDAEGYDIYDVKLHRTYAEWKEAILLYERVLKKCENGEIRHRAIRELSQLYLNTGEHDRALALIETAPDIYGSREFLKPNATDGRTRAAAYGEALLKTVRASAELMVTEVITHEKNMSAADKAESLRGAIGLFTLVCTDGNCGLHHAYLARIYTLLSLYLWMDGRKDEAFEALHRSSQEFRHFEKVCANITGRYTAPLVRLVQYGTCSTKANDNLHPHTSAASLAEDWPWRSVPEYEEVKPQIQADPRWNEWTATLTQ